MTKLKTIFFAASALVLLGISACKDPSDGTGGNSADTSTPRYTVSFAVEGGNGTLKAEVDGVKINSGAQEEKDKMVIFTVEPDAGYVLEQWTNAGTVISEAGTKKTYTHTVTANMDIKVKFKEIPNGTAVLTLSPDKLDIKVKVITADGSPVTVEGCTVTTFTSGTKTTLHAKGTVVILKGKITELNCDSNNLTGLNVQGLTALQSLACNGNQLTALNVQGLTALQILDCLWNQLTALNVQGLTALQRLACYHNRLTALNVQGLTALQTLYCSENQLTALNVQSLTALQSLDCYNNQLTALDVQGCTALQSLLCCNNRLTADAFKKLFDDLPVRADSDNAWCVLYTEKTGVTEGNHTDFTVPSDLADAFNKAKTVKNWKMHKLNGSGNFSEI